MSSTTSHAYLFALEQFRLYAQFDRTLRQGAFLATRDASPGGYSHFRSLWSLDPRCTYQFSSIDVSSGQVSITGHPLPPNLVAPPGHSQGISVDEKNALEAAKTSALLRETRRMKYQERSQSERSKRNAERSTVFGATSAPRTSRGRRGMGRNRLSPLEQAALVTHHTSASPIGTSASMSHQPPHASPSTTTSDIATIFPGDLLLATPSSATSASLPLAAPTAGTSTDGQIGVPGHSPASLPAVATAQSIAPESDDTHFGSTLGTFIETLQSDGGHGEGGTGDDLIDYGSEADFDMHNN